MRKTLHNETGGLEGPAPVQEVIEAMDTMREYGAMAFASRLKRLGDRLKSEATKLYRTSGVEFNDSWFLVALALSKRDEISVTEVAEGFGVSHSAISQIVTAMARKGLLTGRPDERDRRRTHLHLTEKGRSAIEAMRPIWNAVGDCTTELISSTDTNILQAITEIEEQLEQKNLFSRVTDRMKTVQPNS
jgi:DNA-binding MarR family transcriptional regulator